MKKPKKPIRLLNVRQLRHDHGLSWHRVQRRVDRGDIVPFAFSIGPGGNEISLFHPNQLKELLETCKNRAHRHAWVEEALEAEGA